MLRAFFHSGNPGFLLFLKATVSQCILWPFIVFLLLGTLDGFSSTRTGSTNPTHSNFFRSTLRGRHRVSWCAGDPKVCTDPEKNPWGGTTCCFQKFCKDIASDNNHCGVCGRACDYGLVCCDGKCVDIQSDSQHCGACFEECPLQNRCSYAMCDYGG